MCPLTLVALPVPTRPLMERRKQHSAPSPKVWPLMSSSAGCAFTSSTPAGFQQPWGHERSKQVCHCHQGQCVAAKSRCRSLFCRTSARRRSTLTPLKLLDSRLWHAPWFQGCIGVVSAGRTDDLAVLGTYPASSYHLSTPLWGLGSENSGHDIDESLGARTSSY